LKIVKRIIAGILLVCLAVALLKAAQVLCRKSKASFVAPASLDSWDPLDRGEAARNAAQKYGGKR
jgi:hypothetical protein